MGRESPEIPVAPCVDEPPLSNRTTWPTSSCRKAGGRSRTSCVTERSVTSVASIRHRSGRGAAATWFGPAPPPAAEDFDMVKAVRKMDLWLPLREVSSRSDYADHTTAIRGRLQGFLGAKTKGVIPGVAHRGAVPDIEHAESARWLRALSMESRLLRWIACSDFGLLHDWFIEAKKPWTDHSTFAHKWQTIEDRELLCVEEVARASTSSHLSCHFDGFMVHKDIPPVTSSKQFLHGLATHLRITTGLTIPFDLKEQFSFTQLLVRTAHKASAGHRPSARCAFGARRPRF